MAKIDGILTDCHCPLCRGGDLLPVGGGKHALARQQTWLEGHSAPLPTLEVPEGPSFDPGAALGDLYASEPQLSPEAAEEIRAATKGLI